MSKHILSILLLNIAVICIYSIFVEFNTVDEKIRSVNSVMSASVDSAVQLTLNSEELFGQRWSDDAVTSDVEKVVGGVADGDGANLTTPLDGKEFNGVTVNYYSNGWTKGELYNLSKEFDMSDNTFPSSVGNSLSSSDKVYDWLFTDSSDFKEYYDKIGKTITTKVYKKDGTSDYSDSEFHLSQVEIPVLDQMGILDKDINDEDTSISFQDAKKLGKKLLFNPDSHLDTEDYDKDTTLPVTDDNDESGTGVDKSENSAYYLTPTSLGVTYLDPRVLKTLVTAHLQTTIKSQKGDSDSTERDSIESCLGLIPLNVFHNGHQYKPNIDSSNTFNNGVAEFDLSSLTIDVKYVNIDAYSSSSDKIMSVLEGATVGSDGANGTSSRLKNSDTINDATRDSSSYKNRIVAQVTVGVDINIPYSTPIMQYFRFLAREDDTDRIGIRPMGSYSKGKDDSSVLRCNYTTYVSVGR